MYAKLKRCESRSVDWRAYPPSTLESHHTHIPEREREREREIVYVFTRSRVQQLDRDLNILQVRLQNAYVRKRAEASLPLTKFFLSTHLLRHVRRWSGR
jgi:hypothetical protein